jgi:hypothetical protein
MGAVLAFVVACAALGAAHCGLSDSGTCLTCGDAAPDATTSEEEDTACLDCAFDAGPDTNAADVEKEDGSEGGHEAGPDVIVHDTGVPDGLAEAQADSGTPDAGAADAACTMMNKCGLGGACTMGKQCLSNTCMMPPGICVCAMAMDCPPGQACTGSPIPACGARCGPGAMMCNGGCCEPDASPDGASQCEPGDADTACGSGGAMGGMCVTCQPPMMTCQTMKGTSVCM